MAHLLDLLDLQAGLLRQLLDCGLASEAHRQLALDTSDLARPLGDVHGQANRASGVLQATLDRLTDPEGGVGGEAKALAPVELLARPDQAEQALLDEVGQRQALVLVAPRVEATRRRLELTSSSFACRSPRSMRCARSIS